MTRFYNVRMEDSHAKIILSLPIGQDSEGNPLWEKRFLIAKTPEELWNGINALDSIWEKPNRQESLKAIITSDMEHARLAELTSAWEAQGNTIKKLPMLLGKKLRLSLIEEEEILALLESIDEEEEGEVTLPQEAVA